MQRNRFQEILRKILRFPKKMRPASLQSLCESNIRFPSVTHDYALESSCQNFYQDFRASTLSNHNKCLKWCGECPDPMLFSLNMDSCFIHIKDWSISNLVQDRIVFRSNRISSATS